MFERSNLSNLLVFQCCVLQVCICFFSQLLKVMFMQCHLSIIYDMLPMRHILQVEYDAPLVFLAVVSGCSTVQKKWL